MGLRNPAPEGDFEIAYGMDNTTPLSSMKPGYVRIAYNTRLGRIAGYMKRPGYSRILASPYGAKSFTGGIEFQTVGGVSRILLFATDGTASGGELCYTTGSGGAPTNIVSSLSGSARPCFVSVENRVIFMNGVDSPRVYDGSSLRQMGITAPASAPTGSQGTTGNLVQTGTYSYAYTYYNSVTGAESSPSPLYTVTLTGTNDDVTLTLVAGTSTTADTIRIWRTNIGGTALFLDGTALISATSYTSTVADVGLGRALELDNTRLPDLSGTANFPCVAGTRVFVRTGDNEVRWSKNGLYQSMPESFEVKSVADTTGNHGNQDKIVGIANIGNLPIILKKQSVGRLSPIGLPDVSQSVDTQGFEYVEISDVVGAVSHWGAVQVENELVFLGNNNVYRTNGQQVIPCADAIQSTIRSMGLGSGQVQKISAANDTKYKRIYFQIYNSSSATYPTYTLVGDYAQPGADGGLFLRWTIDRPGVNSVTHPGLSAGCFIKVTNTTDGTLDVWAGNIKQNGELYLLNDGNSDDGSAIHWEMISRPYAMGQPINLKLFKKAHLMAQGDGNDYSITVSAIYNLSAQEVGARNISLYTATALWDNSNWDEALWASDESSRLTYAAHRKAYFQQLVFRQTEADAPVTLFGWASTASLFSLF